VLRTREVVKAPMASVATESAALRTGTTSGTLTEVVGTAMADDWEVSVCGLEAL
jgi:hypothetical protein